MAPFIYGKRNTIHIIDIRETLKGLLRAKRFITQTVARGQDVLFVGTKRQARPQVVGAATRVAMPYVAERWLGGTLTNFRTIRSRLARLEELEGAESDGTAQQYSKKMIATRSRELFKIKRNLDGIRRMTRLPGALVIVDVSHERIAVREAQKMKVPTVCLIDTDSDPDFADIPIPGNDDAMRAISLILEHLADAVEEGVRARTMPQSEEHSEEHAHRRRPARPALARSAAHGEGTREGYTAGGGTTLATDRSVPSVDLSGEDRSGGERFAPA
jgi:small subunit ribosomal protein S2